MGNGVFRIVVDEGYIDDDGDQMFRTALELMAPAGVLRAFAANAVNDALGVVTVTETVPEAQPVQSVGVFEVDPATPDGPEAEDKPKRKRRTKAEIEADRARAAAAAGAQPVPDTDDFSRTTAGGWGTANSNEDAAPPAPASVPAPVAPAVVAATPAPTYNPFAQ